jgi:hypothetical protein
MMDTQLAAAQVAYHSIMCAVAGGDPWLAEAPHPALAQFEAAPDAEPKLPKWARRLAEMRATLECELLSGGGLRWWCNVWEYHTGMPTNYSGKTKQAAVKAAWRAWRQSQEGEL